MIDELFDVVNENDEVIDCRPRSQVHRQGLFHRAVHILIFNRQGQLFLQKRSMKKDMSPGVWDSSAAGHLECGETYDHCATREVQEELGVSLTHPPTPLFKLNPCLDTGQEFVWIYQALHEGPFHLHPDEIDDGMWFTPIQIHGWITHRSQDFASTVPLIWSRLCSMAYQSTPKLLTDLKPIL